MGLWKDLSKLIMGPDWYRHSIGEEIPVERVADDAVRGRTDVYEGVSRSFDVNGHQERLRVSYWRSRTDPTSGVRMQVQREQFSDGAWQLVGGPRQSGKDWSTVGAVLMADYNEDGLPDISFEQTAHFSGMDYLIINSGD